MASAANSQIVPKAMCIHAEGEIGKAYWQNKCSKCSDENQNLFSCSHNFPVKFEIISE
jgi:hypothetical protein